MFTLVLAILLYSSIICMVFAYFMDEINLYFLSLLLIFLFSVIYSVKNLKKNIVLFLFLITFFVFLLGRYIVEFLHGGEWWRRVSTEMIIPDGIIIKTFIILYFSLLSLIFGHWMAGKIKIKFAFNKTIPRETNIMRENIRLISATIFWLTYIGGITNTLYKLIYIKNNSYLSYYTEYEGNALLSILENINTVSFFMYLATLPPKKKTLVYLFFYLFANLLTILTGIRGNAVIAILIVIFYCYYRDKYKEDANERWFSKKLLWISILLLPFGLVFLKALTFIRAGISYNNLSFWDLFLGFFQGTGGSGNLISYALLYNDELPSTNVSYVFGPIINLIKDYQLFGLVFSTETYSGNSIEYALYGNSFSHTISYLVLKNAYLRGRGLGSSYIAELYVDFGVVGIIVFNIILGYILYKYSNLKQYKIWQLSLLLLILNSIFFMSRASALNWLILIFRETTIITILSIYLLSIMLSKRYKKLGKKINY